jgi:uncharacterized protein YxjI
MLGDRRRERREERRGGGGRTHFRMRQKLVSIGDDYWIEDEQGERVFKVDGKALRARKTLIFEDAHGNELLKIQERMLRVRDTMEIEDADGHSVATVKKAMITPLRERWTVDVANGPDLRVQGNIVDHEYRHRGWRHRGGRGVQEVVPRRGHLRGRGRTWARSGAAVSYHRGSGHHGARGPLSDRRHMPPTA